MGPRVLINGMIKQIKLLDILNSKDVLALASIGFMVWAIALKFPLGNGAHFDSGPSRTAKAAQSVGTSRQPSAARNTRYTPYRKNSTDTTANKIAALRVALAFQASWGCATGHVTSAALAAGQHTQNRCSIDAKVGSSQIPN